MRSYFKNSTIILLFVLFTNAAYSQGVYFINQSNSAVYITRRTLLEEGSFPYALDKDEKKLQHIPLQTTDPAIYNIMMEDAKGSFGTSTGRMYLLKPGDTIVLNQKDEQLHLTHASSAVRTRELAMGKGLVDGLNIKPLYMLDFKTYLTLNSLPPAEKDRVVDSLSMPVMNYIAEYCKANDISAEMQALYRYNFMGMRYQAKLDVIDNSNNNLLIKKTSDFYKDSVAKWATEFTCDNCTNVPFYNNAAKHTFNLLLKELTPVEHLKAIAGYTKGNTRDFLLSAYMAEQVQARYTRMNELMVVYQQLCNSPVYKKMLADNILLAKKTKPVSKKGLAMLMTADKKQVDFNDMIKANKGNIIYIDFWASWCHPCLAEIPFSLKLHDRVKNDAVKMVYISIDDDVDKWINMAKRQQVSGADSYLLMNAGKDGLSKLIELGPIPRYLIIGKDGKFIDTDASRPSEPKTYEVLKGLADK